MISVEYTTLVNIGTFDYTELYTVNSSSNSIKLHNVKMLKLYMYGIITLLLLSKARGMTGARGDKTFFMLN